MTLEQISSNEAKQKIADWVKKNLDILPDRPHVCRENGDGSKPNAWKRRAKVTIDGVTYRLFEPGSITRRLPNDYAMVDDRGDIIWISLRDAVEIGIRVKTCFGHIITVDDNLEKFYVENMDR